MNPKPLLAILLLALAGCSGPSPAESVDEVESEESESDTIRVGEAGAYLKVRNTSDQDCTINAYINGTYIKDATLRYWISLEAENPRFAWWTTDRAVYRVDGQDVVSNSPPSGETLASQTVLDMPDVPPEGVVELAVGPSNLTIEIGGTCQQYAVSDVGQILMGVTLDSFPNGTSVTFAPGGGTVIAGWINASLDLTHDENITFRLKELFWQNEAYHITLTTPNSKHTWTGVNPGAVLPGPLVVEDGPGAYNLNISGARDNISFLGFFATTVSV